MLTLLVVVVVVVMMMVCLDFFAPAFLRKFLKRYFKAIVAPSSSLPPTPLFLVLYSTRYAYVYASPVKLV